MVTGDKVKVTVDWNGKRRFTASGSSGESVLMDASSDLGGEGSGHTPKELLLSSLAGCMGIGVVHTLEKMRQQLDSLNIGAAGERDCEPPHALRNVVLTFTAAGEVDVKRFQRAIMLEKEKYCPVAASLNTELIVRLILNGQLVELE
ncbi:OsmC family protein [Paenibacillus senegalensis]|uniref:OsmC family protein n=1 Tax=Paenibacillus senegalensis TaxID=1465766 RepID=UPI000289AEF6|nr:OsmC family protein [Paenibacillus senegalensis]